MSNTRKINGEELYRHIAAYAIRVEILKYIIFFNKIAYYIYISFSVGNFLQ